MFNNLRHCVEAIEEAMIEYSQMPALSRIRSLYNWSSEDYSKTPEYNRQRYTFKYGEYDMSDMMRSYS